VKKKEEKQRAFSRTTYSSSTKAVFGFIYKRKVSKRELRENLRDPEKVEVTDAESVERKRIECAASCRKGGVTRGDDECGRTRKVAGCAEKDRVEFYWVE
jgi:hypothetical protein